MKSLPRAWELFCQSFIVLSEEEGILIFPVLSAISAILLGATFFVPLFAVGTFQALAHHRATWMDYVPLFSWYLANTFVVVFFNSAMVACTNIRLSGGKPTVSDGLRIAAGCIHRIAAWALLSATVGILLRIVEEQSQRWGRILASFLGIGWTMLTYLIVPVIVLEDRSVTDSVSRSAQLFRKTWGEQMAGGFGFGLLNMLLILPGVGLALLMVKLSLPLAVIMGVVYMLMLAAVTSAVRQIFTVALYRYATSGEAPFGFTADSLGGAAAKSRNAPGEWQAGKW